MDLQQSWAHFLKAEQLLEEGHWPEAHYLFDQVLNHLPQHVQNTLSDNNTKPCQFSCLLSGLRDATVYQSEILNKMGNQQQAFQVLNQSYALLQFLSIEPSPLVEACADTLYKHSEDLLRHIGAFCAAQRSAQWMLEFQQMERTHHHFATLKHYPSMPRRMMN
ncbi:hypothetical protein M1D72_01670 [Vibrio sp. AK197]|uniref:Tetratricopeptide repeat protein n=1 Tax=Vibrio olivae TaxID=1243002 RepID=A0ABV5HRE8_9VIBR